MNRTIYLLALLLAACGGGGDDPAPTVIQPVFTEADTLDSFEVRLRSDAARAPRPAVITACGFAGARMHRIRLVAHHFGLEVLHCP